MQGEHDDRQQRQQRKTNWLYRDADLERGSHHYQCDMTGSDRDDARPEQRKGQDGNVFWDLAAPEVGLMSCSWLYFESRTTPQRFCDRPGHPYCEEYQREMDACFLTVNLISPRFNSNPAFLRARRIQRGRKTRTLHKNGEECGTRKFNPPPKHGNCRECSGEYP